MSLLPINRNLVLTLLGMHFVLETDVGRSGLAGGLIGIFLARVLFRHAYHPPFVFRSRAMPYEIISSLALDIVAFATGLIFGVLGAINRQIHAA